MSSSQSSQYGSSGTASAEEPYVPSRAHALDAIKRRIGDFVAAWNQHDPAQMAAIWHADGDLINPFGRLAKGRDQVEDLFRDDQTGPMKSSRHEMAIAAVRHVSDDVAIVDADCTISGMCGPAGNELPTFKPHVLLVMTRKDGDWRVLSARAYGYTPRPGM